MKNKTFAITTGLIASLLTTSSAFAARDYRSGHEGFTDTAKVISAEPVYNSVTSSQPTRQCWQEDVYYKDRGNRRDNTAVSMIIGGALGGALGHNIGRHSDSAKIAGAVIGSAIGYDATKRKDDRSSYQRGTEEHCETVYENQTHQQLEGYQVTYRYHGETFTTFMNRNPGDRVRIRVNVSPLD